MQDLLGKVVIGRNTPGFDYKNSQARSPGLPRTEAERQRVHYARYGTTALPPRGTGAVRPQGLAVEVPWGALFVGGILGFTLAALVLTPSGREIGAATGKRAARKIRGNY